MLIGLKAQVWKIKGGWAGGETRQGSVTRFPSQWVLGAKTGRRPFWLPPEPDCSSVTQKGPLSPPCVCVHTPYVTFPERAL